MRAILVIVATLGTIIYNSLAATGHINASGLTPEAILDRYPTVITPAGYAFTIWNLVYLGMAVFAFYQGLTANLARFRVIRSVHIFGCLLNCGWIYFWHRGQVGVCAVLILALVATLIVMLVLFIREENANGRLFTTAPIGIYAGWVTAISLVNLATLLKYLGAELSNAAWNGIGVSLIILAALAAILVRTTLKNFLYPLPIAWALTAIAIKQGGNTAIVVASAIGVVICLLTAGSIVIELKDSTSE
jgi:hypothetical protein